MIHRVVVARHRHVARTLGVDYYQLALAACVGRDGVGAAADLG
jgi:hypothetical protein